MAWLPEDAFGSDDVSGYKASYTWQANQLSHTLMGFLLGVGFPIYLVLALAYPFKHFPAVDTVGTCLQHLTTVAWVPFLWLALPVIKEAIDLLHDQLLAGEYFPVQRKELLLDSAADVFFWSSGILLGIAHRLGPETWWLWLVLAVVVVGSLLFRRRYVQEKSRFDDSGIPLYNRLSNLKKNQITLDREAIAAVHRALGSALDGPSATEHLVICGPPQSNKTLLAEALGCELTVRGRAARYASAVKLLDSREGPTPPDVYFREIHCAIVDDLNGDEPLLGFLAEPALALMRAVSVKTAIWVFTSQRRGEQVGADVQRVLGVPAAQISVIETSRVEGAPPAPAAMAFAEPARQAQRPSKVPVQARGIRMGDQP